MLKKIFSIDTKYYDNGNVKFNVVKIFGHICLYLYRGYKVDFSFADAFKKYFKSNNMDLKIKKLKQNMDELSCEYIDHFMRISKFWGKYLTKNYWSAYDKKLINKYEKMSFEQPYPDITTFNKLTFYNKYGLINLSDEVLASVNGKDIIDIGGLNGDTALIFKSLFPESAIYVYEPLSKNIDVIKNIAQRANQVGGGAIVPFCKGLGDKQEIIDITFNYSEKCEITTLDKDYKGSCIGLIKMDTEGFESKIVEGASSLIKQYKPVLIIAIYHTPEDFFEIKDKILNLNPDYKFMIRRSEFINFSTELVLIAY